ncbi:DUF4870 domain-containing protein [Kurthia massiliensis]|uniref:DUF4870 domain-containing protein n=1 Tax=Kurthia massiliensis TaxID=1033739 RepID=UPI000288D15C|nr:DUF4870 domain-containing protein [Kurthia massiliensis]
MTQSTTDNKVLKVIVHASGFFSSFYVSILVPLITYFVSKDAEVKSLSIQAIIFQLLMGVLISISALLAYVLIGIPFLIVFVAMTIIVPIVGIVRALQEKSWSYPIIGRFF